MELMIWECEAQMKRLELLERYIIERVCVPNKI